MARGSFLGRISLGPEDSTDEPPSNSPRWADVRGTSDELEVDRLVAALAAAPTEAHAEAIRIAIDQRAHELRLGAYRTGRRLLLDGEVFDERADDRGYLAPVLRKP